MEKIAISESQKQNITNAFKGQESMFVEYFTNLFIEQNIIEDQLVTAIEGGINYWGGIDNRKGKFVIPKGLKREDAEPLSIWCSRIIKEGGSIKFFDSNEDEDDSNWILDLNKMIKGFITMAVKSPSHFGDMISENGDATTAEVYIQYCLFGEIVYG